MATTDTTWTPADTNPLDTPRPPMHDEWTGDPDTDKYWERMQA